MEVMCHFQFSALVTRLLFHGAQEPPEEEHKHMLAWYYKRQEDQKVCLA